MWTPMKHGELTYDLRGICWDFFQRWDGCLAFGGDLSTFRRCWGWWKMIRFTLNDTALSPEETESRCSTCSGWRRQVASFRLLIQNHHCHHTFWTDNCILKNCLSGELFHSHVFFFEFRFVNATFWFVDGHLAFACNGSQWHGLCQQNLFPQINSQ